MKLRNFSKQHVYGMLIGIFSPLVFVPFVMIYKMWSENYTFQTLWYQLLNSPYPRVRMLSVATVVNLVWFYLFLNKEKWNWARGVILGTLLWVFYVVYIYYID